MTRPRVLCVDDEPHVLEALKRVLRKHYDVTIAVGGEAALALLTDAEPFESIVSDMRMPRMNGATLLFQFKQRAPDTVRLLLTGHTDLDAAIAAVNEGHIFRFLTKPCPPEVLLAALDAASQQHRLVTAERVLLGQTLLGSIRAMTEVLGLTHPEAFGPRVREHELASLIAERLRVPNAWHVEVAAMLSSIGFVSLPNDVVAKLNTGAELDATEREMVARVPEVAERVLSHIPRLENVREVLKFQDLPYAGGASGPREPAIPIGARILKAVRDFCTEEARRRSAADAIVTLRARSSFYDPDVLEALAEECGPRVPVIKELSLRDVKSGMLLAADVEAATGMLLVARGQRVTEQLLERLRNFALRVGVVEPILCEIDPQPSPK
jgi:response regulator RpfG family c-di-GMP phosphodiesterase